MHIKQYAKNGTGSISKLVCAGILMLCNHAVFALDWPIKYQVIAGQQRFTVDVALNDEQREQGLMHRRELPQDRGLLMVLDRSRLVPIWMKNMHFPLDVAWISDTGVVVDKIMLSPCRQASCPVYTPTAAARYVLEVGANRLTLNIGDKVEILDASGDSLHPPESGHVSQPDK